MKKTNSLKSQVLARQISVVYRDIAALTPDPANPRRHSKKQIRQIAQSIATFGFNVPVLVDAELKVIAGHGRLLACQKLGWSEVPTLCLDHLTPAQSRGFMIADNRLSEIASWDDRLLAEQLKDLSVLGLDFSLEVTGFEVGEIDLRIGSLDSPPPPVNDPADAVPAVAPGPAVTKPGDLWLLGRHRVLCGNALDIAACSTLMGEGRAAMVFTDPPYNVAIDGHATGLGKIRHRSFAMATGEMSRPGFVVFLATALRHLAGFSAGGALLYVCIDWRHIGELLAAGRDADARLENLCVWAKDNAGMGSLYRSQHELVLVFKTGRGRRPTTSSSAALAATAQILALPRGQLVFAQNRRGQPLGIASDRKTGGISRRCDPRLHGPRRHRARRFFRQRHDPDRGRAQRSRLLWVGARSPLCRHNYSPLAGTDRRDCPPCGQWPEF